MEYTIRELRPKESYLLDDFLYEAIFQKDENNLLPREVINEPSLRVYTEDWGKKDDHCLFAESHGKVLGAVWVRIMKGYGYVDDTTPEFTISLYKEYRGLGIGTELMKQMLQLLKSKGYRRASLSVQKENNAFRLYQKLGFQVVKDKGEECVMVYEM